MGELKITESFITDTAEVEEITPESYERHLRDNVRLIKESQPEVEIKMGFPTNCAYPEFKEVGDLVMSQQDELCTCACHRGAPLMHFIECCHVCPHCGWRIKRDIFEEHRDKCGAAPWRVNSATPR